jgi:hypothetical protein
MTRAIITAALSLALLGAGSCKKLNETINDVKTQGSLSANIDGKQYSAGATTISFGSNTLWLKGSNFSSDEELSITISNYDKAVSKYTLDNIYNTADYTGDKGDLDSDSGELEIQSTGEKSAKGTFHFESQDGRKVTNGSFDVSWD